MKKTLIAVVSTVLVCCCVFGGTLAWLMDSTQTITNTFTVGDIEIELTETPVDKYKMVPGNVIAKDPKVTVKANSEACWLFIKIDESDNFDTYMTYGVLDEWKPLADNDGVYYREVAATTADTSFYVLTAGTNATNGCVTVKTEVNADQLAAVATDNQPTLSFTAYAVQKDNVANAATAWGYATTPNP